MLPLGFYAQLVLQIKKTTTKCRNVEIKRGLHANMLWLNLKSAVVRGV